MLSTRVLLTEHYDYHVAFSSTKRILGCSTVSRKEHICAQTREVACTKIVLPEVIENNIVSTVWCFVHFCVFLSQVSILLKSLMIISL